MTIEQARQLAQTLRAAADAAEKAGMTEVPLPSALATLREMDDAARAELAAAISAQQR